MAQLCRHTACGGCSMTGIPYEEQLARKHQQLKALLSSFGEVLPPIGMEEYRYYRNKVTRTFAAVRDEKKRLTTVAGTYAAETRRVVPIDSCQIEDPGAQRIMNTLAALCTKMKI